VSDFVFDLRHPESAALKRLAAAVRFRPWPPFFKHLQRRKTEFGSNWFQKNFLQGGVLSLFEI
jgi:hypothetical protein